MDPKLPMIFRPGATGATGATGARTRRNGCERHQRRSRQRPPDSRCPPRRAVRCKSGWRRAGCGPRTGQIVFVGPGGTAGGTVGGYLTVASTTGTTGGCGSQNNGRARQRRSGRDDLFHGCPRRSRRCTGRHGSDGCDGCDRRGRRTGPTGPTGATGATGARAPPALRAAPEPPARAASTPSRPQVPDSRCPPTVRRCRSDWCKPRGLHPDRKSS